MKSALAEKQEEPGREYFLVRISAKRYDFEQDNVFVGINGEAPYMLKRGVAVPVPGEVLESLRHAQHPIYTQKPGEDRKVVGMMERFPFEVVARLTPETYQELREISKERELTDLEVKKARGY